MSPLKLLFYKSCSFLPMEYLQKISPATTLLPYHHTVSNGALPHVRHLYPYKNVQQFTQDLDTLLKYNKPISADDLNECVIQHKPFPKKTFLLSFDDGLREVHDIIAPILEAKGVPAVFFINPAFINNSQLFLRAKASVLIHELVNAKNNELVNEYRNHFNLINASETELINILKSIRINDSTILDNLAVKTGYSFKDFLLKQQPYLTTAQLVSLKSRGFAIGGHSINHPYYEQLSLAEQLEQTIASCHYVQQQTAMKNQYFSFPFNDANLPQALFDELKNTGINLFFGLQNQKDEIENKMLHRFNAERSFVKFDSQLKGILLLAFLNKFFGKNTVHRS